MAASGGNMDIKVGDTVHVKMRVIEAGPTSVNLERLVGQPGTYAWVARSEIVHVDPRPLQVGDKVRVTTGTRERGELIAVDGTEAWVKWPSGCRSTWLLSNLARVEPDAA
jgi:hypothetical protein